MQRVSFRCELVLKQSNNDFDKVLASGEWFHRMARLSVGCRPVTSHSRLPQNTPGPRGRDPSTA